jgi:hypothetical protein
MQWIAATVLQCLMDLCRLLQLHDLQHIKHGSNYRTAGSDQHAERSRSHPAADIKG